MNGHKATYLVALINFKEIVLFGYCSGLTEFNTES